MKAKQYPSQAELRALFDYKDGQLIRNGKVVGTDSDGYRLTSINYKKYYVHRLIYIYHYGDITDLTLEIDHLNHNKSDNRIENLRLVTKSVQSENKPKTKGYCWSKHTKRFVAQFRNKHVGSYGTECGARLAYLNAKLI